MRVYFSNRSVRVGYFMCTHILGLELLNDKQLMLTECLVLCCRQEALCVGWSSSANLCARMRGYLFLSALIGLVAAQLSLNDVDVTTDFALDIPAAQRAKFDTETIANLSEIEKDIINETKSIWSWIRQVIASPMSIGDYACLTMKAKCGKTLLRQTIQIGYCEPLGTDMSFKVSVGQMTKCLHLPEWIDPTGGSITIPKFSSQVYDDTQCTVNSTRADAGLASLRRVHKIHIKEGKCVVKVEEEPLPTLPSTATNASTTLTPTETTTNSTNVPSESGALPSTAAEPEIGVSEDVTVD